jgi:hypothetical protein
MSFFGFLSVGADSQNFAMSRRDILEKISALTVLSLLPKPQSKSSYPPPEFKIGDLVAYDWECDDHDAPDFATDFGEILGMRWVPEPDGHCLVVNTWVYFIRWTHSTCGEYSSSYPCYDGEPTESSDLRLVSAEEICKR